MPTNEPKPPASEPKVHVESNGLCFDDCPRCLWLASRKITPPVPEPAGTTVEELAERIADSLAEFVPLQLPADFPKAEAARRFKLRVLPILRADREARERAEASYKQIVEQLKEKNAALEADLAAARDALSDAAASWRSFEKVMDERDTARERIEELTRERDDALRLLKFPVYSEPVKALLARLDAPERPAEPPLIPAYCAKCDGWPCACKPTPPEGEARRHAFVPHKGATPETECTLYGKCHYAAAYCGKPASDPVHYRCSACEDIGGIREGGNIRLCRNCNDMGRGSPPEPAAPIHQGAEPPTCDVCLQPGCSIAWHEANDCAPPAEGPGEAKGRWCERPGSEYVVCECGCHGLPAPAPPAPGRETPKHAFTPPPKGYPYPDLCDFGAAFRAEPCNLLASDPVHGGESR